MELGHLAGTDKLTPPMIAELVRLMLGVEVEVRMK
jgi:hypothetical protein